MRPIDPDAFADAVLLGAHQHSRIAGHTYNRRALTRKQRCLTAALADGDGLGIDELREAFTSDWTRIHEANPERDAQAFFQNIADLATRVNAYLLAGYRNTITRDQMQRLLDGRLIAIYIDDTQRELCALDADTLEELLPKIGQPSETRRRRKAEPAPQPEASAQESVAVTCRVDPVTGRWTLEFPDGQIEIDPRLETIRKDTILYRWPSILTLPDEPEALTTEQLATIRDATR